MLTTWGPVVVVVLLFLLVNNPLWTDEEGAEEALAEAGYRAVATDGYAWWACRKNEPWATAFKAVNPEGVPVSGAVCSGPLRGTTIRLDPAVGVPGINN